MARTTAGDKLPKDAPARQPRDWNRFGKMALLSTLSGCLLFFSFADWDIWPFGFFFVVPMMLVADMARTRKEAWWWSLWGGWVANVGGFWWIAGLLMDFGQMPVAAAVVICLIMNLYQGVAFGIFGTLYHALRKGGRWPAILLAPVVWVAVELLFPLIFPYYLGNSQFTFAPMTQVAELLGPLGVGAILFLFNGALYDLIRALWVDKAQGPARRRALIGMGAAAAVAALNIVYGYVRIGQIEEMEAAAPKLKIGLVEADIGIWSKEDPDKLANNLIIHQQLSKKLVDEDKVDLLVWPESSYQADWVYASTEPTEDLARLEATAREYRRWIPHNATWLRPSAAPLLANDAADIAAGIPRPDRNAVQRDFKVPVLFGGITFRPLSEQELATDPPNKKMIQVVDGKREKVPRNFRVYNTATLIDAEGRVKGTYNKTYLLAFGEYIPGASLAPWLYDMIPAASEFTPGNEIEVFELGEHRLGVMICYEDILPRFGRKLAALNPDVLINVTNDAWFGKTSEPYLHLALATFRTVESRKWLLRSTNTGVSVFVDAAGRIRSQTEIYNPETLSYEVPMLKGGPTLYTMIGDVIGYLALAGLAALLFLARRRREEGQAAEATPEG